MCARRACNAASGGLPAPIASIACHTPDAALGGGAGRGSGHGARDLDVRAHGRDAALDASELARLGRRELLA